MRLALAERAETRLRDPWFGVSTDSAGSRPRSGEKVCPDPEMLPVNENSEAGEYAPTISCQRHLPIPRQPGRSAQNRRCPGTNHPIRSAVDPSNTNLDRGTS